MYGLVYVFVPSTFTSLQAELDRTLAPFMRGGDEEFSRDKLAFRDATDALMRLHRTRFRYNPGGSLTWLEPADASYDLCLKSLTEHMGACALDRFEGTFTEIEPKFDAFVCRLTRFRAPDATTGRYGDWLNPIGYWDWWELGGRYNGVITGERRPVGAEQVISSGPSRGRAVLGNIATALGASAEEERAEIEANVELVETLKAAAQLNEMWARPSAVVLPLGSCADEVRWFDNIEWHDIGPRTRQFLGVQCGADYHCLVRAAYDRFADHVAAGVAFHF